MAIAQKIRQAWDDFWGAVGRSEEESRQLQAEADPRRVDRRTIGVIVVSCITLALLEYYGSSSDYKILEPIFGLFVDDPQTTMRDVFRRGERAELFRLTYWSAATFVCYFLLPAFYIKVFLRERIRDFGLQVEGILKHAWVYVAMYLIVLPFVIGVAFTEPFQKTYPFYDNAHLSIFDFFGWEILYMIQFFSLEFFFRGFMIHGTKHRFGFYAIMVSVVPYCMIHFGKPLPETIGSIIAGLALGILSLFSRSVWLGVAIHVSVAVTMDLLSMLIQGRIF